MILVLDIYDILKQTRKKLKVNEKLTKVEFSKPYASDEAYKEY
jgi:hypothetical protein